MKKLISGKACSNYPKTTASRGSMATTDNSHTTTLNDVKNTSSSSSISCCYTCQHKDVCKYRERVCEIETMPNVFKITCLKYKPCVEYYNPTNDLRDFHAVCDNLSCQGIKDTIPCNPHDN
jgi:hypothetical protein